MAITYTTPDGTVVTTLQQLADWHLGKRGHAAGAITNAQMSVNAHIIPGTPRS